MNAAGGWSFSIDRGGTFTDLVGRSPRGSVVVRKVLSRQPHRPGDPAVRAIRDLLGLADGAPIPPGLLREVRLGTTVATNALLERATDPVLLLLNHGFADLLRIGDQQRPDIFALRIDLPPLPALRVLELHGRLDAEGQELEPLRLDAALAAAVREAAAAGFRSVAVALLHSSRNPAHELAVGAWLTALGCTAPVLSHQVSPQPRLVPRGTTCLVEAAIRPVLHRYLTTVQAELGPSTRLRVMTSSGALRAPELLLAKDTILSGPAGGLVGAAAAARLAGLADGPILGFDMGGTSTDVFHLEDAGPELGGERRDETEIIGLRLQAPMLPIHTVAAGGGSVLALRDGRLTVGPRSAGAAPGPACYGFGGPLTLTDAHLLLGRLPVAALPPVFGPDGNQAADRAVALRGFRDLAASLAASLDPSLPLPTPESLAQGALTIAVERMAEAIRRVSIQRGHDIRGALLVCFGGAGGLHACALAARLGLERVLLPPLAGVLSAWGIALARQELRREILVRRPLQPQLLPELRTAAAELAAATAADLRGADDLAADAQPRIRQRLELRVPGRERGLEVDGPGPTDEVESLRARFEALHRRRFGYGVEDETLVVERLVVEVAAPAGAEESPRIAEDGPEGANGSPIPLCLPAAHGEEMVWGSAPLWQRSELPQGQPLPGPAVVLDSTGTLVLEPGWSARRLPGGELLLERVAAPSPPAGPTLATPRAASHPTAPDPVVLELYNHRFTAIAEQMGVRLQQSARSVNMRERLDFSCALFDGDGQLVANAPHIPVHLGSMGESVRSLRDAVARGLLPPPGPGDAIAANDPFHGGTHLPDITVITPVFPALATNGPTEAAPLFYVACRGHHADVGGLTPGSMPPFSRTLAEEGLLLDNVPLLVGGVLQRDSWRQRLAAGPHPVRNPEQLLADLQAQLAANRLGMEELQRLIDRQGEAEVCAYMSHVQSNAAEAVRRCLTTLPDGAHAVELDDGAVIRVAVRIDRQARRARVDFSGTSDQQPSNRNAPLAITRAVVLYVFRCLVGEAIPLNAGCFAPIELVVPEGCMLHPRPPAAVVAGNVETSQAIANALFGALGVLAAAQGTMNNLSFGDAQRQYYETLCGGTGAGRLAAGHGFAGASAVQSHMTNSRLTDPEILEERFPVRLERFALRRGSGGAGRWRGGDGVVRELRFLAPLTVALLTGSRRVPPFGLAGGEPGLCGRNAIARAAGDWQELPGCAELAVEPGDRLRLETPGGGGFGPPSQRLAHSLLAGSLLVGLLLADTALAPAVGAPSLGTTNALAERRQRFAPVGSAGGIVAAEEREAMAVGAAVLRRGGNAVDAAVATAFAQAVTLPYAGNLGGGGFLLLWLPGTSPAPQRGCPVAERRVGGGFATAVNFRETAPRAARPALFLGPDGRLDPRLATRSLRATAVPGSVAGLLLAQRCYGRLSRQQVLAPAIRLAEQGFPVGRALSQSLAASAPVLQDDPGSRRLFFRAAPSGSAPLPLQPGDRLRQGELAATLRRIAAAGEAGFYEGPVAEALVALMRVRGGLIEAADLRAYRARLVEPLAIRFRGHPVLAVPPPGGGLSLLQLLRLVEPFPCAPPENPTDRPSCDIARQEPRSPAGPALPVAGAGLDSADGLHLLAEAMALVFRDRNTWLGDPEQTAIPIARLLSDGYLASLRRSIDPRRHRPPGSLPSAGSSPEGSNTTHLSVADRQGGLASLTTTLNLPYGNGVLVPGAGFLLNNEMDDFTLQPGAANAFGLVQGPANALAPGRRPLSSMTPTLVFRPDGTPWLATGSPGGSRIITAVAQVLLQRLVVGLNLAGAVNAPRLHNQLLPDRLELEEGFSADTRRLLAAMGHTLLASPVMGAANSVEVLAGGGTAGAVDPRRGESLATPE